MELMELGRIHRLGQGHEKPFPVLPAAVAVAGAGLLVGGLVVKGASGTVMGVVGSAGAAASILILILDRLSIMEPSGAPAATPTAAAPPSLPPPPPVIKATDYGSKYARYAQYAQAALPIVNQLFTGVSSLFSSGVATDTSIKDAVFSLEGPKSMWRVGQPDLMVA